MIMGGVEGGIRKLVRRVGLPAAAQRAALPSPEAAQKNLRQARATKRMSEEKEVAMEDGEGVAGDLPGYVPTVLDRRIK